MKLGLQLIAIGALLRLSGGVGDDAAPWLSVREVRRLAEAYDEESDDDTSAWPDHTIVDDEEQ